MTTQTAVLQIDIEQFGYAAIGGEAIALGL